MSVLPWHRADPCTCARAVSGPHVAKLKWKLYSLGPNCLGDVVTSTELGGNQVRVKAGDVGVPSLRQMPSGYSGYVGQVSDARSTDHKVTYWRVQKSQCQR